MGVILYSTQNLWYVIFADWAKRTFRKMNIAIHGAYTHVSTHVANLEITYSTYYKPMVYYKPTPLFSSK